MLDSHTYILYWSSPCTYIYKHILYSSIILVISLQEYTIFYLISVPFLMRSIRGGPSKSTPHGACILEKNLNLCILQFLMCVHSGDIILSEICSQTDDGKCRNFEVYQLPCWSHFSMNSRTFENCVSSWMIEFGKHIVHCNHIRVHYNGKNNL